jgi:hypothetical protein
MVGGDHADVQVEECGIARVHQRRQLPRERAGTAPSRRAVDDEQQIDV